MIYFDNAATTFCHSQVAEALTQFYKTPHGNPSAIHILGFETARLVKEARQYFASSFAVAPEQVIFTASGTEANNLALSGVLRRKIGSKGRPPQGRPPQRSVILSLPIEHASVLRNLEYWGKEGFQVQWLKVDASGKIDLSDLSRKLSPQVILLSTMAVNNEIGTIEPIEEIGRLCKEKDREILFHVDAVQAFGKIPLKFESWGVDLMTLSSHKIHGPVGSGALIIRKGLELEPLFYGGGQEFGWRSGTESAGMIHGFHLAAKIAEMHQKENFDRLYYLKRMFQEGIQKLPYRSKCNSPEGRPPQGCPPQGSSPYILNVSFPGFPSEVLLRMLESEGILTSAGSSCSMKKRKQSAVLSAIGCAEEESKSSIRFSFSPLTEESEIMEALVALPRVLKRLEKMV
jgi:cysteine desulfurase